MRGVVREVLPQCGSKRKARVALEDGRGKRCTVSGEWPWNPLALRCDVPPGAERGRAVVRWACVRADATLLVDDVSVSPVGADGPQLMGVDPPALLEGERVPRLIHLIFGLSHDFGGKPFGLVHHLVIKA